MSQQSSRKKKFEGISYTVGNNLVRKTYLKNFNLIPSFLNTSYSLRIRIRLDKERVPGSGSRIICFGSGTRKKIRKNR